MFPGAKVACSCGVTVIVPGGARSDTPSTPSPFRTADNRPVEAAVMKCPFCGGPCAPDVRACPHCNVELASVRCPHCFALHFAGSRFCARCGKALALEPLLDPTDAPCPRCDTPLRVFGFGTASSEALPDDALSDLPMHECTACGGMFVSQTTLDAIIKRESPGPDGQAALGGALTAGARHAPPVASSGPRLDVVRYVKCPLCHELMNRNNFGKRSGVIVDVCRAHGVWFDKGELTQAIEFVAHGGLTDAEKARHGDVPEGELVRKETAKMHAALMEEAMKDGRDLGYAVGRSEGYWTNVRHKTLLDVLFELLR
jgi:Zn-finger nucleic acid-binding protein